MHDDALENVRVGYKDAVDLWTAAGAHNWARRGLDS
jgi:hypothetical protein